MTNQNHNELAEKLVKKGFQVFVVGGAVRDELLGLKPNDVDLCTNATPEEVADVFKGHRVNLVGDFFKVTVVDDVEVATFRGDKYLGLNHKDCVCQKVDTVEEDLQRRDLTVNSMARNFATGELVDPFGGRDDLKNRVVKFTGNPVDRLTEDPNRHLRACRFLATLDASFDEETFDALKACANYVPEYVAPERLRLEVLKAMKAQKASKFFYAMKHTGTLKHVLPSLDDCFFVQGGKHHREGVFEHCMLAGDHLFAQNPLLRLTGYLHDVGKSKYQFNSEGELTYHGHEKDGEELVRRDLEALRFSNDEVAYVSSLVSLHMTPLHGDQTKKAVRRALRKLAERNLVYQDFLALKVVDRKSNLGKPDYTEEEVGEFHSLFENAFLNEEEAAFSVKDLKVTGNDVMELLNLTPCKRVGEVLNHLLTQVVEGELVNTRESLLAEVEKFV